MSYSPRYIYLRALTRNHRGEVICGIKVRKFANSVDGILAV